MGASLAVLFHLSSPFGETGRRTAPLLTQKSPVQLRAIGAPTISGLGSGRAITKRPRGVFFHRFATESLRVAELPTARRYNGVTRWTRNRLCFERRVGLDQPTTRCRFGRRVLSLQNASLQFARQTVGQAAITCLRLLTSGWASDLCPRVQGVEPSYPKA